MKKSICFWALTLLCVFPNINCKGANDKITEDTSNELVVNRSQERSIQSISALYYNYIVNEGKPLALETLQKDIPHFEIETRGVLDIYIADSLKLNRIRSLIETLEPSMQQNPVDARIAIKIHYTDNTEDTLCIGGRYTNRIFLNGIQQATNNKVLFHLKNYIGFYPWLIGEDLFRMSEMKDNSFMKEPFVSTQYYKDYQKALVNR